MARWRLTLLGGFELRTPAGTPVPLSARKAAAVLAHLALRPDMSQGRDRLAALLWDLGSDAQARGNLRQALATLRRELPAGEEAPLAAGPETVALLPARIESDVGEFEAALGDRAPGAAARAAALYRGDLLDGFEVNAPAFAEWLAVERQRLRELAAGAMRRALDDALAGRDPDDGIRVGLRLVALDPLQESGHRALMRLYARQGRHAEALRQYRACREALERELGVAPDPETERALREVRERRRAAAAGPAARPGAASPERGAGAPEAGEPEAGTFERRAFEARAFEAGASDVAAARAPAPGTDAGPEMRHVAVLCVDLSGIDGLFDGADPEEAHRRVVALFDRVGAVVEGLGGTLRRPLGDAAFAVFGAPRAHGDDPRRAVRAALGIHAALAAGAPVSARVGVACGHVVIGRGDGTGAGDWTLTGAALRDARRLAALAGEGQTLVTDDIREALGGHPCDGAGNGAWRVDGPLPAEAGEPAPPGPVGGEAAPAAGTPFVGRRAELAQLSAALSACVESGFGSVLHLRGEPGIGKTRLLSELRRLAAGRGFRCAAGSVTDEGVGRSQEAIRELVRGLVGAEGIGPLVEDGLFPEALLAHLAPVADLPQTPEGARLHDALDHEARDRGRREAIAALVRGAARRHPLLLCLEDVHWGDAILRSYLALLASAVADCRAVLATTTRHRGDPVDGAFRAASGGAPVATIDLGPLRPREALELAGGFAAAPAPAPYAEACVARAGGNPLFLEQLLRRGAPGAGDGAGDGAGVGTGEGAATPAPALATIPATIHAVVLARTDELAPADRRAIQAASVLGPRFALDALRHAAEAPGYAPDALLERALVRPDGEGGLAFAHVLVQEAVRDALMPSRRRRLHRLAAAWYEARDPGRHAEHLAGAGDPAAAAAHLRAARHFVATHRQERAQAVLERGLALRAEAGAGPAERFELGCLLGEVLDMLGEVRGSLAAFEGAAALAATDAQRARALYGLASGMRLTDEIEGALGHLGRAEAAAARAGLAPELSRIHHLRGNLLFPRGDIEGCLREHEAALDWARRAGAPDLELAALGGLGDAHYVSGRMRTAHDYFARCVEGARARGLPRIEAANLPMVGAARLFLADPRGAAAAAEEGVRAARAIGHRRGELLARILCYEALGELGEVEAARAHLGEARALARQLGAYRFEAENLMFEGRLLAAAGEAGAARDALSWALALSRETGIGYIGPSVMGELALVVEDEGERRRLLAEGEATLAAGSVSHNHLEFHRAAIEAMLDMGDWAGAERHAAALEGYARAEPSPWTRIFAARGRALARHGRAGGDAGSRAALAEVLAALEGAGLLRHAPRVRAALAAAPAAAGR